MPPNNCPACYPQAPAQKTHPAQPKTLSDFLAYAREIESYCKLTNRKRVERPPEFYDNWRRPSFSDWALSAGIMLALG